MCSYIPLSGATVELYKDNRILQRIYTDYNGRASLYAVEGEYTICAEKEGYQRKCIDISLTSDIDIEMILRRILSLSRSVTGSIVKGCQLSEVIPTYCIRTGFDPNDPRWMPPEGWSIVYDWSNLYEQLRDWMVNEYDPSRECELTGINDTGVEAGVHFEIENKAYERCAYAFYVENLPPSEENLFYHVLISSDGETAYTFLWLIIVAKEDEVKVVYIQSIDANGNIIFRETVELENPSVKMVVVVDPFYGNRTARLRLYNEYGGLEYDGGVPVDEPTDEVSSIVAICLEPEGNEDKGNLVLDWVAIKWK